MRCRRSRSSPSRCHRSAAWVAVDAIMATRPAFLARVARHRFGHVSVAGMRPSGLELNSHEAVRVDVEGHPPGTDEPLEAAHEDVRLDTELSRQVVETTSNQGVARDDLEDPRLNEEVCRERRHEHAAPPTRDRT